MKLIQKNYENTIIIQKSKFIAEAYRVNSVDEVEQILSSIRKKYYDASHHCYAYHIDQNLQKMSDDGEPAKTAGAPILDVILKKKYRKNFNCGHTLFWRYSTRRRRSRSSV